MAAVSNFAVLFYLISAFEYLLTFESINDHKVDNQYP